MKRSTIMTTIASLMFILVIALFVIPKGIAPNIIGLNHKNVTVWTYLNITNSKPEVLNVTVYAANNFSMRSITLIAGYERTVYCNATIRDWNGFNNIVYVNGTLWHAPTAGNDDADDNNTHYTNVSCTLNETTANPYIGQYICAFDVLYYANNGTWNCNVSIMDTENKTGWRHNTTVLYPLYALNVTDGIDYGNVAVEDFTAERSANVTNLGNMPINVTVQGYGTRLRDGLAMNCTLSGNITVENERFALSPGVPYASKTALTSLTAVGMSNLTIPKQTVPNDYIVNATYWEMYVPPNPAGNCSGFIVFTAIAP